VVYQPTYILKPSGGIKAEAVSDPGNCVGCLEHKTAFIVPFILSSKGLCFFRAYRVHPVSSIFTYILPLLYWFLGNNFPALWWSEVDHLQARGLGVPQEARHHHLLFS
jgi:hypothetical protein